MSDDKRKLREEIKLLKDGKLKGKIKTHVRDMIILPDMVGLSLSVHNGKEFHEVTIKSEMVGHYLGEYSITNKRVQHGSPGVGSSRSSLYVPLKWLNMPTYHYSFNKFDKSKHVRSSLRERDISHKHAREIALAINGKSLEKAREFLERVINKEIAVPFRRYHNEVAHRSNIIDGFSAGRFPKKASNEFLRLLDNLETNAEYKGMDLDRLKIISIVVHKATKLKRFTPRAMGRSSPKIDTLVHVEIVAQEGQNN